jgi:hypothetical protein
VWRSASVGSWGDGGRAHGERSIRGYDNDEKNHWNKINNGASRSVSEHENCCLSSELVRTAEERQVMCRVFAKDIHQWKSKIGHSGISTSPWTPVSEKRGKVQTSAMKES